MCVGHADAAMLTLGGAGFWVGALLRRMGARAGSGIVRTAAVGKRWIWSTGASVRCALSWATRRAAVEDMATGGVRRSCLGEWAIVGKPKIVKCFRVTNNWD